MTPSSIGRSLLGFLVALGALGAPVVHADGNVSAVVRNGQLILRGDNADNQLRITTDGAPAGGVTIIPVGTTINGTSPAFLDVPDIPRGVRAGFGGGEDTFGGSELETFPGDLVVDMGGENDTVAFTDLVADRCDFSFGAGHDNVGFDTLSCAEVRIRAGGGDDRIVWQGGGVSGATSIGMSGGPDGLQLSGIGFGGPVRVTMGGGDDILTLESENTFDDTVHLSGGAGSSNALVDDGTNVFAIPPTIVNFQQ